MSKLLVATLLVPLTCWGCRFPATENELEIVSSLRFSPSAFDSFSANTEIRYSLKIATAVTLFIVRRQVGASDQIVRVLTANLFESKGSHSHTWLGDTAEGYFAPAGEYVGILIVRDQRLESIVRVFHF